MGTGHRANQQRNCLQEKEVPGFLDKHFPQRATHFVSPPHARALRHRVRTVLSGEATWTPSGVAAAAREFEAPEGHKIHMVWPDLFDRDILLRRPEYRKQTRKETGEEVIGVMTPCPWCHTNKFVSQVKMSGVKSGRQVRKVTCAKGAKESVVCPIMTCKNPECGGSSSTASRKRR